MRWNSRKLMTTPRGALKIISAFIKFQYNNLACAALASCAAATTTTAAAPLSHGTARACASIARRLSPNYYIARVYIMQISWVHILLMSWCVIALAVWREHFLLGCIIYKLRLNLARNTRHVLLAHSSGKSRGLKSSRVFRTELCVFSTAPCHFNHRNCNWDHKSLNFLLHNFVWFLHIPLVKFFEECFMLFSFFSMK